MASVVEQAKAQMAKTVENTKENFAGIRTGRANPALLNGIMVDYYGAPTPIKAVASIGVPEPRTLSVTVRCIPGWRRREGDPQFRSWREPQP